MFASKITGQVVITSHGREITVAIRALAGKALRKASEARELAAARAAGSIGVDALQALRAANKASGTAAAPLTAEQRYALYDVDTVLAAGVTGWSAVDDEDKAIGVCTETLADLEADAETQLHRAILDLSLPPIDPKAVEELGKGAA